MLCFLQYYVGEYRKSLTLFRKAIALYDKSNNKHDEESARLYVMYGLSQFRTGDSIASEKSFKQAIRFCSLSGSGLGAFFWGNLWWQPVWSLIST